MKKFAEICAEWGSQCIPVHADPSQRRDMEMSFYCGAAALLALMLDNVDTEDDGDVIAAMHAEIASYLLGMNAGRQH